MQRLSSLNAKAPVSFAQIDTMIRQPAITIRIADCISKWSDLEAAQTMLLSFLLQIEPSAAIAMYAALESYQARERTLVAIAKAKLSTRHFCILETVLNTFVKPCRCEQERFVHWCWGYSDEIPDAILLAEPQEKIIAKRLCKTQNLYLDRDKIFVVKAVDLDQSLIRLKEATEHVWSFAIAQSEDCRPDEQHRMLDLLQMVPQVREALSRLTDNRSAPSGHPHWN
jgi:hypothetical protein